MLWYLMPILISSGNAHKGFIEEYFVDTAFACKARRILACSVESELQCVQKCLHEASCHTINYRIGTGESKDNCELFRAGKIAAETVDCIGFLASKGWKALFMKRLEMKISKIDGVNYSSTEVAQQMVSSSISSPTNNIVDQVTPSLSIKAPSQFHSSIENLSVTPAAVAESGTHHSSTLLSSFVVVLSSIPLQVATRMEPSLVSLLPTNVFDEATPTNVLDEATLPLNTKFSTHFPTSKDVAITTVAVESSLSASFASHSTLEQGNDLQITSGSLGLSWPAIGSSSATPTMPLASSTFPSSSLITTKSSVLEGFTTHAPSQSTAAASTSVPISVPSNVHRSCYEVHTNYTHVPNGVYELTIGKHFCVMQSIVGCTGGGWTLAMKIDGTLDTFKGGSTYWTTTAMLNHINGVNGLDNVQAKFPAFNSLAFTSLCLGMSYSNETRWLEIPHAASSLLDVFLPGVFIATNVGRSAWKSLLAGSSLQTNCNREGFNTRRDGGATFARIGIMGNDLNDCVSPNSYIGFGTKIIVNNNCFHADLGVSCGNAAFCSSDNGDKVLASFGYILVR